MPFLTPLASMEVRYERSAHYAHFLALVCRIAYRNHHGGALPAAYLVAFIRSKPNAHGGEDDDRLHTGGYAYRRNCRRFPHSVFLEIGT